jgi:DNA-binding transcriptional LysR family regulator
VVSCRLKGRGGRATHETARPTISRKISELETLLNTKLLTRSTRKLTLTAAGAAYVAASKRILEQVGEAEAQATGEFAAPRGELIITGPMTFGRIHLLPIVNDFLITFPEINVRMALSDRDMNLTDEQIDAAVRIGKLPDSGMIATRLGSVRRVICGSPTYFKANGILNTPNDLAALTCVTFANLPAGSSWSFAAGEKNLTHAHRAGPRSTCRLRRRASCHALICSGEEAAKPMIPPFAGIALPSIGCVTANIPLGVG